VSQVKLHGSKSECQRLCKQVDSAVSHVRRTEKSLNAIDVSHVKRTDAGLMAMDCVSMSTVP
jgi:hypothetical protein